MSCFEKSGVTILGTSFPPVIIFKTDPKPSGFDRPITATLKDRIRSQLNVAGVVALTVVFKRDPQGEIVLHFEGAVDEVAKAKAVFERR